MFQLIVAVISIALVAALAIASLYYGGQAFQKSSLKANVTTLVNAGQQIAGADALYKTENGGVGATAIADLTADGEYLAATPGVSAAAGEDASWSITTSGTTRVAAIVVNPAEEAGENVVCAEVLNQAGDVFADAQFGCVDITIDVAGTPTPVAHFAFKL